MTFVMARTTASTESVHQRITRLRKEYGYTQSEIAEMLDVPQSVVSLYESGGRRFHAEIIAKFAEIFGITADELLGMKSPSSNGQKVSSAQCGYGIVSMNGWFMTNHRATLP